jgi:hypothetical protein
MFGLMTVVGVPAAAAAPKKDIAVPPVPANLEVPVGNSVYRVGHAIGTQDYVCLPCPTTSPACTGSGFVWTFFGPQATLLDDGDEQIVTHFLSPNPAEGGMPRATWQDSRDSSAVWAFAPPANQSTDPRFVALGAIPWLRLQVVGTQSGPTDGDRLTETTFIQRLNTAGGIAPATGCSASAAVGNKALVFYEADYFFYRTRPAHGQSHDDDR